MADWYEVQEGQEIEHVRATNTRTAFYKGFTILCGSSYRLTPGHQMTITILRLRGNSEKVKLLEQVYQENRKKKRS